MATAEHAAPLPLLLVIGVLPSDKTRKDWRFGASCRRQARRTWLSSPAVTSGSVVARFAYPVPLLASTQRKPRRRRLAGQQQELAEGQLEREAEKHGDLVPLPTPSGSSCACHELTQRWFLHAVGHWATARFFGKVEDDVFVQLPALVWELARLPGGGVTPLWWGLFTWTGNGGATHPNVGCWGGQFEDDPRLSAKISRQLLGREHSCQDGASPLAPAPTHEIDIRSSHLARSVASCSYPAAWLAAYPSGKRCANDCAAVQGLWMLQCARATPHLLPYVLLAHATWSKVHSNALDGGWRPFAAPGNLTVALDLNLGDKKIRELEPSVAWDRVAAAMGPTTRTALPPLLYAFDPARRTGELPLASPLNLRVASLHATGCRWGGCHPSRGEPAPEWPPWLHSAPWSTDGAVLPLSLPFLNASLAAGAWPWGGTAAARALGVAPAEM